MKLAKDDHLKQAEHNEKLANTLCQGPYLDWAVTVYFYAALHYMTAILTVHVPAEILRSHDKRDSYIKSIRELSGIFVPYKFLDTMRRNAQYYCTPITPTDLKTVQGKYEVVKNHILYNVLGLPKAKRSTQV